MMSEEEEVFATLITFADEVTDAAEETFILFSQSLPHNDLGICDPVASTVELEIAGHEFVIKQSPSLLNSNRGTGTTGAVTWKVTPLVATWLASTESVLWKEGILSTSSNVVELGCGIAGLVGLTVAPNVCTYILTDQGYVMKILKDNIQTNMHSPKLAKKLKGAHQSRDIMGCLKTLTLDWEQDSVLNIKQLLPDDATIDLVVLCDCIYNSYLIEPLVQNCRDICLGNPKRSTVLLIAQQLRTDAVFEQWLEASMNVFRVWRIKDEFLPSTLSSPSGYAVHLAMLRSIGDHFSTKMGADRQHDWR